MKRPALHKHPKLSAEPAQMRRRAEPRLRRHQTKTAPKRTDAGKLRKFHELGVHLIELEMQNKELQEARESMEAFLEKYTDLYDFAPVGYLTLDREGAIGEANLAAASLLGIARSALVKQRFGLFISPEDRSVFDTFLKRVFESRAKEECAARLLVRGKPPVEARMRANVFDSGRACWLAVTEITEQKLAEADERFRLLVEGVEDYAILMLDPHGHVVSWNSGAEKMMGYGADDIIGRHFSLFYPKTDIATGKPERALQIASAKGRFEEEDWRVRRDRTQFWADVTTTVLPDDEGKLRGFATVIRDITERKYAEKILRESEERTRSIVESAPEAFISMDAQGRIIDWNRQAEQTFGWAREMVVGRPIVKTIVLLKDRKAFLRGLERYQASGKGLPLDQRLEVMALHRDGHQFPIEATMTCLRLQRGYILSAFLRDISERKRAEEKLRQIPGKILGAQEAERKRVARELHDSVGQILSSVKMRLQTIEQAPLDTDEKEIRPAVAQVRSSIGRCIEEVRRIARNLMPGELEDLGLIPAVRSLCAEFREESKLEVKLTHVRIPNQLANDAKLALFRIIQEALSNIVQHAAATRIAVDMARKGSVIKVSITDDGRGFDPQPHASRGSKKPGMGMLNLQARAAVVGGRFRIRSAPGRGTKVEVEVPFMGARDEAKDSL